MTRSFIDLNELEIELVGRSIPVTFRPESSRREPVFEVGPGALKFEGPSVIYEPDGMRLFRPHNQPYSDVNDSSDGRYTDYGSEGGPLMVVRGGWVPGRRNPNRMALHRVRGVCPAGVHDVLDNTLTSFSATCVTVSDVADEIESAYLVSVPTIAARKAANHKQINDLFGSAVAKPL